jgi:hypothetical protein
MKTTLRPRHVLRLTPSDRRPTRPRPAPATLIIADLQNHDSDSEEALLKTERLLGAFTRYRERQDLLLGLRRVAEEAEE